MSENINLTKILRNCPKGWKLWSPIFGEIEFYSIVEKALYPIMLSCKKGIIWFSKDGLFDIENEGAECVLFPSKDQRDWSKFTAPWYKKDKFNPKTLQPFDKVLVKRYAGVWVANLFSHYGKIIHPDNHNTYLEFITISNGTYRHCIPYNDDTKHLVGTTDEAPEYYRYWED